MSFDILVPSTLPEPSWGALGEDVFRRTYSRRKEDGSYETWRETCERVVRGNCGLVDKSYIEKSEPTKLFKLLYNFDILPGGRHLWVTGIKGSQFVSNCWVSSWSERFSEHFGFAFARLMEGGGVGANYSNPYLSGYDPIPNKIDLHVVCDPEHKDYPQLAHMISNDYSHLWQGSYAIEDSREGWVDALVVLLDAFYGEPLPQEFPDGRIVLDVSKIRPAGKALKTFGGTASGPAPLVEMLHAVCARMNKHHDKKPDSMLCLDLDHEIARCVVAGNVRRSARISLKHWADHDIEDFITMKADSQSHWTTNVSVILDHFFWMGLRRKEGKADKILRMIAEGCLQNGEPGVFNITKANEGEPNPIYACNPCAEVTLSEWGSCILGSVNLKRFVHNDAALMEAFRLMTRFLVRATFADCPDPKAKAVVERDRRIGVGFTGFADWLILEGVPFSQFHSSERHKEVLAVAKKTVRRTARDYAFQLRIPEPVKVTTTAPTGTTSKLCGVSEGMQPTLYKYFKRRVNYSTRDAEQQKMIDKAIEAGLEVEDSVYTPDTKVVSYVCRASILDEPGVDESIIEEANDISLEEYLDAQKTVQDIYVDNSISFTVNVDPERVSVEDLEKALASFGPHLKGTTIMPSVSNRPQMPYERITKEAYLQATHKFSSSGEIECKNNSCKLILRDDDE